MKGGTRRMWSRRILRAGWALAPIAQAPGRIRRWAKRNLENLIFLLLVAGAIGGFCFLIHQATHGADPVSPQEIREAAEGSECVKFNMPQLIERTVVIRVHDLEALEKGCEDATTLQKQKEELAKILK
ncbi:hypothetical protein [Acinetobacter sp.]|uniref:hypothetical protein n=1 Tax=Acinetobacter sp. TaxID=472 RepID=UPI0038908653